MEGLLDRQERINEQAIIFFEEVVKLVQNALKSGPRGASEFIYPLTRSSNFNHRLLTCLVNAELIDSWGEIGKHRTRYALKGWTAKKEEEKSLAVAKNYNAGLYITLD